MEFPKEIWIIIKSYEYQLLYYKIYQKIMRELWYNAYMPYYLGLHEYKGGEKLFDYSVSKKDIWCWDLLFTTEEMKSLCNNVDKKALRSYLD